MIEFGQDIPDWLGIARGDEPMPPEFQRMIAAWEVVVRWHRVSEPGDLTDTALKAALRRAVPDLGLADDQLGHPLCSH